MVSEAVLAGVVITGVFFDLRERRIPNWLTLPALGLGFALQGTFGGLNGLLLALGGALAGAALLGVPFVLGWVGGGDLKLLAAIGSLMGAPFALWTLAFASAAGGIMAMGWLAMTGSLASSLSHVLMSWRRPASAKPAALSTRLSFGPALAIGALMAQVWRWPG